MGTKLIITAMCITLLISCNKNEVVNYAAQCVTNGYINDKYSLHTVNFNQDNINFIIYDIALKNNYSYNYIKEKDTVKLYNTSSQSVTSRFAKNEVNSKISELVYTGNWVEFTTFGLDENKIKFSTSRLKMNDTQFYHYYSNNSISKIEHKSKDKLIKTEYFEYYTEFPYLDLYKRIGVLSILFKLDYNDYILKAIKIDSSGIISNNSYTVGYNNFKYPDKLISNKDTITLLNYCK